MFYLVPRECTETSVPAKGCAADTLPKEDQSRALAKFLYAENFLLRISRKDPQVVIDSLQKFIEISGVEGINEILTNQTLVQTSFYIQDDSTPLNYIQKELVRGVEPCGDLYTFEVQPITGDSFQDCATEIANLSGWERRVEYAGQNKMVSPDGENYISFHNSRHDHTEAVECVLTKELADRLFYNLTNSESFYITEDGVHCAGPAYPLDDIAYGFAFHKNADAVDDWIKQQITQDTMLDDWNLTSRFRENFVLFRPLERSNGLFEAQWVQMEITRLLAEGELVNVRKPATIDEPEVCYLAVGTRDNVFWKDVSSEHEGRFTIQKDNGTEMLIISQDRKGNFVASVFQKDFTKKSGAFYRGSEVNEAMKAVHDYEEGKIRVE